MSHVVVVEDTNHHFTGKQKTEYDSLRAKGRTAYDLLRWFGKATHNEAFRAGRAAYGLKQTI